MMPCRYQVFQRGSSGWWDYDALVYNSDDIQLPRLLREDSLSLLECKQPKKVVESLLLSASTVWSLLLLWASPSHLPILLISSRRSSGCFLLRVCVSWTTIYSTLEQKNLKILKLHFEEKVSPKQ